MQSDKKPACRLCEVIRTVGVILTVVVNILTLLIVAHIVTF